MFIGAELGDELSADAGYLGRADVQVLDERAFLAVFNHLVKTGDVCHLAHLLGDALVVGREVALHLPVLHVLLQQALALGTLDVTPVFCFADQVPQESSWPLAG